MKRYIDANKLIGDLNYSTQNTWGKSLGYSWWSHSVKLKDNMVECINNQPTADVEEVRHGEWKQNPCVERFYYCSECNRRIEDATKSPYKHFPYCHCGAKMDGGKAE